MKKKTADNTEQTKAHSLLCSLEPKIPSGLINSKLIKWRVQIQYIRAALSVYSLILHGRVGFERSFIPCFLFTYRHRQLKKQRGRGESHASHYRLADNEIPTLADKNTKEQIHKRNTCEPNKLSALFFSSVVGDHI